ncbi:MAG: hypothetical protein ACYDEY_05535 [Acidimicrobiales bacterium]
MRIVDTRIEPAGDSRFVITTTVAIDDDPDQSGVAIAPPLGAGPVGDAIPDLIVQALAARAPEPLSLGEIHQVVGGNPGTINRQAWTLARNAPDLQQQLREWVVSPSRGQYGLSPAAIAHLRNAAEPERTYGEDTHALQELSDGVTFWRSRRNWPADFHNADYRRWSEDNPHGNFTMSWWRPFLVALQAWIATRPTSGQTLTQRFMASISILSEAWQASCEPFLDADISAVTWDQVAAFPTVVATIKPTLTPSPVFTSKFCHFLLPKVFPVVDNEALGGSWSTYEAYFRFVQEEWASTSGTTRAELVAALAALIEATGTEVFSEFPMANKIVELRVIGRRHPHGALGGSSGSTPGA